MARLTYRDKQLAIRRLLLDQRGKLNPSARVLAIELRRVAVTPLIKYDRNGAVDPAAIAVAAAGREIWDHFVRLLHLEPYETANLREEE